jgi:serine/threonine protein kinase
MGPRMHHIHSPYWKSTFWCTPNQINHQADNIQATLQKVSNIEYKIPYFLSQNAQNLIHNILQKDPRRRPNVSRILEHPFFSPYEPLERPFRNPINTTNTNINQLTKRDSSTIRANNNTSGLKTQASELAPFNTDRISPITHKARNGIIQLDDNGDVTLTLNGEMNRLRISKDSSTVLLSITPLTCHRSYSLA